MPHAYSVLVIVCLCCCLSFSLSLSLYSPSFLLPFLSLSMFLSHLPSLLLSLSFTLSLRISVHSYLSSFQSSPFPFSLCFLLFGLLFFGFDSAEFVFGLVNACICEVRPFVQAKRLPKFFCDEEFLCGAEITESVSSSVCLCMRDYFPVYVWVWV